MSLVQGLAGLFQAPADLLYQGTFDEARNEAQEKQQWLVRGAPLFDRPQIDGVRLGMDRSEPVLSEQKLPRWDGDCHCVPCLKALSSKLTKQPGEAACGAMDAVDL